MRILHFIWGLGMGGAETMLIDICNSQSRVADIFIVVGNDVIDESVLKAVSSNIKLIRLDRHPGSRNPWPIIKLNWIIKQIRPDVIHCHTESAIRALWLVKAKKVLTVHHTQLSLDKLIRRYDRIFAISEAVRQDIIGMHDILKPTVIHNGINFAKIKTDKSIQSPQFYIVQIGRLAHEIKGQDILLTALHILIKQFHHQNLSLDIIGEGASRDYLESMSRTLGIDKYVNFLGEKSRDYIYNHLCEYDLLVQPSRREGFGLTIVEAMAARVPVLVSNIEGPIEIIKEGKYGYFFEQNDSFHAAGVIKSIIEKHNTLRFKEKVELAYQKAMDSFDVNKTAMSYIQQYQDINSRHNRSQRKMEN